MTTLSCSIGTPSGSPPCWRRVGALSPSRSTILSTAIIFIRRGEDGSRVTFW
jgi:hypothetical protein